MTDEIKAGRKKKHEKPKPEDDSFGLDITFEEALERFLNVDPDELEKKRSQKSKEDS